MNGVGSPGCVCGEGEYFCADRAWGRPGFQSDWRRVCGQAIQAGRARAIIISQHYPKFLEKISEQSCCVQERIVSVLSKHYTRNPQSTIHMNRFLIDFLIHCDAMGAPLLINSLPLDFLDQHQSSYSDLVRATGAIVFDRLKSYADTIEDFDPHKTYTHRDFCIAWMVFKAFFGVKSFKTLFNRESGYFKTLRKLFFANPNIMGYLMNRQRHHGYFISGKQEAKFYHAMAYSHLVPAIPYRFDVSGPAERIKWLDRGTIVPDASVLRVNPGSDFTAELQRRNLSIGTLNIDCTLQTLSSELVQIERGQCPEITINPGLNFLFYLPSVSVGGKVHVNHILSAVAIVLGGDRARVLAIVTQDSGDSLGLTKYREHIQAGLNANCTERPEPGKFKIVEANHSFQVPQEGADRDCGIYAIHFTYLFKHLIFTQFDCPWLKSDFYSERDFEQEMGEDILFRMKLYMLNIYYVLDIFCQMVPRAYEDSAGGRKKVSLDARLHYGTAVLLTLYRTAKAALNPVSGQ